MNDNRGTLRRRRAPTLFVVGTAIACVVAVGAAALFAAPAPSARDAIHRAAVALKLPEEPWWGGPDYYQRFAVADAAGWDEPEFFPISVFYGKPEHAAALADLGINTFMGAERDGSPISTITSHGVFVLAQAEWTPAEIGDDARVVGWQVSDECDMGYSDCTPDWNADNGEHGRLAVQESYVERLRALNDGRFLQANFGSGVLGTHWAPTTMPAHVALMDVTSVDKYAYTSAEVRRLMLDSPFWPAGRDPASAGAYGWLQDRMETFSVPAASTPNWVFVETARPLLNEADAGTITAAQIEGAVWNAIIHGAAGIAYFQHNNDETCGTYSLVDCPTPLRDAVQQINADVTALAPVINTPSYQWDFGDGLDTSLKANDGHAYIFAMTDGGTGSRTLQLPPMIKAPHVEVVGEEREIVVASDGTFQDSFSAESTHHIYRVRIAP